MDQTEMYSDVSNKSVRQILVHQLDKPIGSYITQFIDNKLINPNQSKDVEDVIRAYWSLQDMSDIKDYRINPIQQKIDALFAQSPQLIKKLHYCRSFFTQQQIKYTKSIQAIVKIGKYHMFTTEYDVDAIAPILNEKLAWGQTSGLADKQVCLLIASPEANWLKSIVSPDDIQYMSYIQKMFQTVTMADNLSYISTKAPMAVPKSQMFATQAYASRVGMTPEKETGTKLQQEAIIRDKYDIIYGNPFAMDDVVLKVNASQRQPWWRKNSSKQKTDTPNVDDTIHTGVVSKYGLIDCYTFNMEHYRTIFDEYVKSSKLEEENKSYFDHVWTRFKVAYEQILRGMVDRAIMITHQTMVDFLISVYERKFTIPQLMMYYSPGTMLKIKTAMDVYQCTMVLNSYVNNANGELVLTLNVLNPNTTKEADILIHDTEKYPMAKSVPNYDIGIISAGTRSGSIFNYFTMSSAAELMLDEDIARQLEYSKMCLKMAIKPKHMQIDGNYHHLDSGELRQVAYKDRVIVDYVHTRAGYSDFNKNIVSFTHSLQDAYDKISLDYYKDKIVYPGGIQSETTSMIFLTGDKFLSDIRLVLSLPVIASAYILGDKRWGLIKVSDLQEVEYHPEAYEQLVLDPQIKDTIRTVAQYQTQNTFKDIVGGKESGCIYLFAGISGSGKTSTAEAIAEKLQKPLYHVSAGELGSWESVIENELKYILKQAERWDAIVLMDEADAFLYKREGGDISRNAMVATFLRQLEYFNGTLFLTSNRAEDIDPAFESRILQCIKFVDLTQEERATIWINLTKLQGMDLNKKQALELAKYQINGRQIKNIIKVAIAMSLSKDTSLTYDMLKDTAAQMHGGAILTNKGFVNQPISKEVSK